MTNIQDVCDYVILKVTEAGEYLNTLKLHKLLYYCKAWSLAFENGLLFSARFQAWVHGPVSRVIYDRFVSTKGMYSPVQIEDVRADFDVECISEADKDVIDAVLEKYAPLTGDQLEELTHRERPWVEARAGLPSTARSENYISEDTMKDYYGARLKKQV